MLLRVGFWDTMVVQMKNQAVDNKVLIYQNTQCISILAQAPEYIHVGSFV